MSLEVTGYHFGNCPTFKNLTEDETLITIQVWRYSIDWNYDYQIAIPKNYWHSFELVLRYGGGNDGYSSWWLEAKKYRDGEVSERGCYGEMYQDQAIKCVKELDIKSFSTYDNFNGLKKMLTKALTL
jgi:hypothetical protein